MNRFPRVLMLICMFLLALGCFAAGCSDDDEPATKNDVGVTADQGGDDDVGTTNDVGTSVDTSTVDSGDEDAMGADGAAGGDAEADAAGDDAAL